MNSKFYSLPREKQSAILNAGFHVFSQNSYKKSPMSEIADAAGMSPHYFCEMFKRRTGRRPIDYLNLYRIDSACRMLRFDGCSVTDAAFSNGFNDLSYFVKTFKKCKGVTPRQYQRRFDWDGI